MKEKPFKTVLFHGLVRDSQGRKMSKSLGNGIDPLEVIDKYGADALRFTLITGNAPGNDMRFYWERVEASRNFANKVWNASRFIMMYMDQMAEAGLKFDLKNIDKANLEDADCWILSRFNTVVKEVTDNMESFELGVAAQKIYDFIYDDLCDWYIEMVKPRFFGDNATSKETAMWTLRHVLTGALKMLHPYMPFITEEIFCTLKEAEGTLDENESIMISEWPTFNAEFDFAEKAAAVEMIKEAVKGIRNVRTQMNVPPSRKATVYVVSAEEAVRNTFEGSKVFFATLGGASEVLIQEDKTGIAEDAVSAVLPQAVIYIPFSDLVDIEKEIERLNKEKTRLTGEIKRGEGMLSNANFVAKAPEAKIAEERAKLENYKSMMAQVEERLAALSK
jgi:valyl-tRNA synthetase